MYKVSTKICEEKKTINAEKITATQECFQSQQHHNDDCASSDEEESSFVSESSEYEDSDSEYSAIDIKPLGEKTDAVNIDDVLHSVTERLNSSSIQTIGDVNIENSTGFHIGNTTNINGNIQIIYKNINKSKRRFKDKKRKSSLPHTSKQSPKSEPDEIEESVNSDAFIVRSKFKQPRNVCIILKRHSWLAQCPMEPYTYQTAPSPYVVVSHTATESSEKRAINVRIVRDVQCFHIESRGWNDIGYNFLIGCDGNIYEGRGWGVVGAHTIGYNICSVGVSFIGCFMRELPTGNALRVFKNLLKKGVEEGHIAKDYKLVTHSQCCSTESPGRKLIEELQKWDNFYRIEDEVEDSV